MPTWNVSKNFQLKHLDASQGVAHSAPPGKLIALSSISHGFFARCNLAMGIVLRCVKRIVRYTAVDFPHDKTVSWTWDCLPIWEDSPRKIAGIRPDGGLTPAFRGDTSDEQKKINEIGLVLEDPFAI